MWGCHEVFPSYGRMGSVLDRGRDMCSAKRIGEDIK